MVGLAVAGLAALMLPSPSVAKTSLGSQRVGTSAGSFLRIGVGARPASMAGAFVAICDDVTACAWNPAGLVRLRGKQVALNHISWPADIGYSHACYGMPITALDGAVAVQFGSLSADLVETQEYYPYGTGRDFTFSDWLVGLSVAKRFTDKFSGGFAVKYIREELGVEVGGPTTDAFVLDAGTLYEIGPRNMHLAVALMNFGPDLKPSGSYTKTTGTGGAAEAQYEGYAPSTEFRFGIAFSPVTRPWLTSVLDVELCHPADNAETFRAGWEAVILKTLSVRGGYDFNADELKASLGMGVSTQIFSRQASLDYGATLSEYLGTVHRISLSFDL
jgi:long-subunit fatty acid transport protein